MVERRGVKNGVKTNKSVKYSYRGSQALTHHSGEIVTYAEVARYGYYDSPVLERDVTYSLDKQKRWEQYDTQTPNKQEWNEKERTKQQERKEKNRSVKKQQNAARFVANKHEKKLKKDQLTTETSKKGPGSDDDDLTSDPQEEAEKVPVLQIGRKGYLKKDGPQRSIYAVKRSFFATDEEYEKKKNGTEVWVPPTKQVIANHYAHDKRHWDDYDLELIMSKRKELKQEMIRINKL